MLMMDTFCRPLVVRDPRIVVEMHVVASRAHSFLVFGDKKSSNGGSGGLEIRGAPHFPLGQH